MRDGSVVQNVPTAANNSHQSHRHRGNTHRPEGRPPRGTRSTPQRHLAYAYQQPASVVELSLHYSHGHQCKVSNNRVLSSKTPTPNKQALTLGSGANGTYLTRFSKPPIQTSTEVSDGARARPKKFSNVKRRASSASSRASSRRHYISTALWCHSDTVVPPRARAQSAGPHSTNRHKLIEKDIEDDARSVCTNASSVVSQTRSDSALLNQQHGASGRRPSASNVVRRNSHRSKNGYSLHSSKAHSGSSRQQGSNKPTGSSSGPQSNGGCKGYPTGFARVQELVKQLRNSRLPINADLLKNDKSGLRELSIHGHQNCVDPVLAWSNLSRPTEKESKQHLSAKRQESVTAATVTTTITCSVLSSSGSSSSVEDDEISVDTIGGEIVEDNDNNSMEAVSVTPFVQSEDDEDLFQYGSNYEKRTGQILNYYTEKETEGDSDGDRGLNHQQKVFRSMPSEGGTYRPTPGSQIAIAKHWRSTTVPMPMQKRTLENPNINTSSKSGRVFMGKRIHKPQKINPDYRPKPVQRRGRSFVQIHQPMSLVPRAQGTDYALHTHSITSNLGDEFSADYEAPPGVGQSLEYGMKNLQIVGTSLTARRGIGGPQVGVPTATTYGSYTTYRGQIRDLTNTVEGEGSSRVFPMVNQDVLTQVQTISPPYSQHTSMQNLSNNTPAYLTSSMTTMPHPAASIPQNTANIKDLCVTNHVNPSPRRQRQRLVLADGVPAPDLVLTDEGAPPNTHLEMFLHQQQESTDMLRPDANSAGSQPVTGSEPEEQPATEDSLPSSTLPLAGLNSSSLASTGLITQPSATAAAAGRVVPPPAADQSSTVINNGQPLYHPHSTESYDLYDPDAENYIDEYADADVVGYYDNNNDDNGNIDDSDALINYMNDINNHGDNQDGKKYDNGDIDYDDNENGDIDYDDNENSYGNNNDADLLENDVNKQEKVDGDDGEVD